MIDRRRFLQALAAAGVSRALPGCATTSAVGADPFTLGVASGYPHPGGMVLWTRLTGERGLGDVPLRWEIAADEGMRKIVASGTASAEATWAHSARVEAQGLEPDRWYWYRFMARDGVSPTGRTRTAPRPDADPGRLRFALASCQQYEQGYYGAYRHLVADSPDLVAFVGDYIYESSWGRDHVRAHTGGEPYTLEDYRQRYALYKSDPDLQAAHAACPWICTWDDHEVDNDYSDDHSSDLMPRERFLARRAAAYRAYYEHMPLPERMKPRGPDMRIYTQLGWGKLGRFFLVDDRQYRSWQSCPRPGRGGSNTVDVAKCPQLFNTDRTMLGRAQERWLEKSLSTSQARWTLLAQQSRLVQLDEKPGPGRRAWTDAWDGYPAARERLIRQLHEQHTANPVVLGGDVHLFEVADVKLDFDDENSPVVASEFVGTSITSQSTPQERLDKFRPDNPHVKLLDGRYRGYLRLDVTAATCTAELRAMDSVQTADAPCRTLATFVVEDGRPGPQRA
ncbi:MAG: alkaline phosphatase D family protein [Burkholderiales bacterium]